MAAPLTIRLHPADNVVVARMDILPGTAVEGEVAAATRVPPGHKILTRAVKQGEPLRKYNQIIGFATEDLPPGTAHPHAQLRHGRFRARLRLLRRCAADRVHRPAGHLPGLSPRRRPRGDAQLHRHRHHGELLGRHQPHDRQAHRAAAGAPPQHRRRRAADPWRRLRHGLLGTGDGRCCAARSRATRVIPTWRRSSCWGWAARPTRSPA